MNRQELIKRREAGDKFFFEVDLSEVDLRGIDLRKVNLSSGDSTIRGSNLSGANLSGVDLSQANLCRADLSYADLTKANLSGAFLKEANFNKAILCEADLSNIDMGGGGSMVEAILSNANLNKANFFMATLRGANLNGAVLTEVNFGNADLNMANLTDANLERADLSEANLSGADLRGSNLHRVNLRDADLSHANLENINLDTANLEGTNFAGANLNGTILPDGERNWYTEELERRKQPSSISLDNDSADSVSAIKDNLPELFAQLTAYEGQLINLLEDTNTELFNYSKRSVLQKFGNLPFPSALKNYISVIEQIKKESPEESKLLDMRLSQFQFNMGHKYIVRAEQSGVLNRGDGYLLDAKDKENKAYADLAIRLLTDVREKLLLYSNAENEAYQKALSEVDVLLTNSYLILYNLTWAHSQNTVPLGILKKGVKTVPTSIELWRVLGGAYERLGNVEENQTIATYNKMVDVFNTLGCFTIFFTIIFRISFWPLLLYGKILHSIRNKQASKCYQKARHLEAEQS